MNKNTTILFCPGPYGGAENIVLNGALELNARLWLIRETRNPRHCDDFERRCKTKGLTPEIFNCRSRLDISTLIKLRNMTKKTGVPFIHSHGLKANVYNSLLPTKRIGTQHGKTSHDTKARILELIEDIALKRMHALICVSKRLQEQYPKKRTFLVENFLTLMARKRDYRDSGGLKLLFAGRLSSEKGLEFLLKAIQGQPQIELTVVGEGPEKERLRAEYPSMLNVKYVGFQKDISPYLEDADALIMPSLREGLPLVGIEAVASGLPILASAVGAIPQLIKTNGLLFAPKDVEGIRSSIALFWENRKAFNHAANTNADNFRKKYSPQRWASETRNIYQRIQE